MYFNDFRFVYRNNNLNRKRREKYRNNSTIFVGIEYLIETNLYFFNAFSVYNTSSFTVNTGTSCCTRISDEIFL